MALSASVLVPLDITDAMLSSCTVAEPAAGETTWTSAATYALGDQRILTSTHRIYQCVQAHTGRTALPSVDSAYWLDAGPTLRWKQFDQYINTATTSTTSLSTVLLPGFCNSLAIYGAIGGTITVTIDDMDAGGANIYTYTGDLIEPYPGFYELLTALPRVRTKLILTGLPLRPNPRITVTVTAGTGSPVAIGLLAVGDLRQLLDNAAWGGTQQGASASPVTTSYIKVDEYGTATIKRRHAATDMAIRLVMPREVADYALATVQELLDVPVCVIGTDVAGYAGLNVFGLMSAQLSYDSFNHAVLNINVKGFI